METPNSFLILREWMLAIVVVPMTLALSATTRTLLKKSAEKRSWPLLSELAPSIANLVYILGLRVFAEVAPLTPKLEKSVDSIIYVLAVVIALGMIRRAAMIALEWSVMRTTQSRTLQLGFIPLVRNLITVFIFFSGAIMVLKRFDYDVLSLLTALGVGSLAVGLAAKDTLANMISGFTLIIDRNLRPGDRINLGGQIGDVDEIGLRTTRLRTGDGNMLVVPNSELVNSKIFNLSMPSREASCSTTLRIPLDSSFAQFKAICIDVVGEVEKANLSRGIGVNLTSLMEGYQAVTVGFWVRDFEDTGEALTAFNDKLLARLNREKFSLFRPNTSVVV